jgi:hypothetical protein
MGNKGNTAIVLREDSVRQLIYVVRDVQIMVDTDLAGGCKNFCVNGHLAGNCRPYERSRNDRSKTPPAGRAD